MTTDTNDAEIVMAVTNLSESMDLATVAEGAETEDHVVQLKEKWCTEGRGLFQQATSCKGTRNFTG